METASLLGFAFKMSVITLVIWVVWYAFLRKVNNFSIVRFFILGGVILSVIMPLLAPLLMSSFSVPASNFGIEANITLPAVQIIANSNGYSWFQLITITYISFSLLFALRLLIQIFKLILLVNEGEIKELEGLKIIEHSRDISPFSFMNYCFINPSQIPEKSIEEVLAHERAHYQKLHTADILLFEIIGLFQWFNPFYWLLRKELVEIHEYQADKVAINTKTDPYAYLDAIVSIAFKGIALPVGNNFNKSLTLKRLAMMNITQESKGAIVRITLALLLTLPIITIISCDSKSDSAAVSTENLEVELQSPPPPPVEYEGEVFEVVEEMPGFDGGKSEKFREYIAQNLKYPKVAAENGIQGRVFVSFIVEADGVVTNVKIARGVDPSLDNEAIRVVESSPRWIPGKQGGEAVRTAFTFPIIFKLN